MTLPQLALIGISGHGAKHLQNALRLQEEGRVQLVAVADLREPEAGVLPEDTRWYADGMTMLRSESVTVVVICTPIHTHFDLAASAVRAGADVLLEKPTCATLDEYVELAALAADRGVLIQVGFQSLGCTAVARARELLAAGAVGDVLRFGAIGAWVRNEEYWQRVRWAGKRTLDGVVVADGVLTNPLAHATATALALSGATGIDDVAGIELEMLRANPIEADDTSTAVLSLRTGARLTAAVTLAAAGNSEPWVEAVGSAGALQLFYKTGLLRLRDADGRVVSEEEHPFADLLVNLLDARAGAADLLVPIEETGAFMRLVDAVMASEPVDIDPAFVRRVVDDAGVHLVVEGVEEALSAALEQESCFSAIGANFAAGVRQ